MKRVKHVNGWPSQEEFVQMSSGGYYNGTVADWAGQNIRGRVEVRPLFSSRVGGILTLMPCGVIAMP